MDNRKKNGGKRENSGRKPKIEEIELIERLSPLEPIAFQALEQGLRDQDFRFVQLHQVLCAVIALCFEQLSVTSSLHQCEAA